MKKILIDKNIYSLIKKEQSFLNRANIRIFTSTSNEKALKIHKAEKTDLIISHLDTPEMSGEKLCSIIRENNELSKVSIIIVCSEDKSDIERSSQCRANAFITTPVELSILFDKAHKLLNIAKRESYRALLGVKVQGKYKNKPFLCFSENISASGILFDTDRILEKGDLILCSFFLSNSIRISANAEIVRVTEKKIEFDPNKYGMKFINLNAEFESAIEAFVRGEKLR